MPLMEEPRLITEEEGLELALGLEQVRNIKIGETII